MDILHEEAIKALALSLAIGAAVGAEREYRDKSAGLRTMILVCMGSCLFTQLSFIIGGDVSADRIAANIVTGIGFLGAGVIFKGKNRVGGITTATTIWMVAALGMAVGAGYYRIAIYCTAAVLFVLTLLIYLQGFFEMMNRTRVYRIVCPYKHETLKRYEQIFKKYKLRYTRLTHSKTDNQIIGNWEVSGPDRAHERVIKYIMNDDTILEFDF